MDGSSVSEALREGPANPGTHPFRRAGEEGVAPPGTLPRFLGYEHFQYTPYGESWVEEHLTNQLNETSHRFTGQELDEETGLYAFLARYYDPQTSRWLGADPAMGEYLPVAGQTQEELPGMGGVYFILKLNPYLYAGNNPLYLVDPNGEIIMPSVAKYNMSTSLPPETCLGNSETILFNEQGCYVTALSNMKFTAQIYKELTTVRFGGDFPYSSAETLNNDTSLFPANSGGLPRESSMNAIFGQGGWDYWTRGVQGEAGLLEKLQEYADSSSAFLIVGIFDISDVVEDVTTHMVGIGGLPGKDGVFSPSSLTPTSAGDRQRFRDETERQVYSMDNLVEIRVVPLD